MGKSIYVEIRIQGPIEELWRLTQTPDEHVRWDLRFTDIRDLPRRDEGQPQRFSYATRIGFGFAVRGEGESVGYRDGRDGERTSALKFWSDDRWSLIREGSGHWRYIPTPQGLRFLTSFDYRVRFGQVGKLVDRLLFRPLVGWATAWSFDRLRLWIERKIDPAVSVESSLTHGIARGTLALVWLYQGIVPKLLGPHVDELAMLMQSGLSLETAVITSKLIGCCELVFGLAMLLWPRHRWHFLVTALLMMGATAGVIAQSPQFLGAAFNPVTLNLLMAAMAWVGFLAGRDLPSAERCLRRAEQPE